MINFFKITDWPIKKFFIMIFTFQLLFCGSIGLDLIGIKIPILRQLICFIYLTFVPGIVILRILKLHKLECIENLLYSVGLSLSVLMFIGFFMNIYYPLVGIEKPITLIPLTITVSFIVLLLCYLCYLTDRNFSDSNSLYLDKVSPSYSIFLFSIPLWTIIGTYLVNYYNSNLLLIVIIFLLSLIIVLVSFDYIPSNLYPLAVFIASISLLLHNSLISMYIFGWDIQIEYYIANKVINNSLWDPNIFSLSNGMFSIVMIAPIYSILSNLDLNWTFKVIYPTIFSLTPIGLYFIFKKQIPNKIAFMSTFFFMSIFVFYNEMLQLARQEIAELFFVLIILVIIQNKSKVSNRILLILFSFSLITSHYGLSYIFIGSAICTLFLLFFYKKYLNNLSSNNVVNITFVSLFGIFLLAWYIYISSSSPFYAFVHLIENVVIHFISDFFNPSQAQGLYIITKKSITPLHSLDKYMHLFTQICISVGIFYIVVNTINKKSEKNFKFNIEYLCLSVVFYLVLIAAVAVPNFASALNTSRLYQITLIILAPFCVIGGALILNILVKMAPQRKTKENNMLTMGVLSIFFALFFLFNAGWIYEVTDDTPTSFSLNSTLDFPKFNDQEITSKAWLHKFGKVEEEGVYIYADFYRMLMFRSFFSVEKVLIFPEDVSKVKIGSYLYFSAYNILTDKVLLVSQKGVNFIPDYSNFQNYTFMKNKIYNNDDSIYV